MIRGMIILSCAAFGLLFSGCAYYQGRADPEKITSINIIDRNGMSETINSKERLNAFENTNFLASQPYQKVLRVYGRQKNGDIHSCITSYHPNGEIKQYLEAVNNRALGKFQEWHANGNPKVEAYVIGGMADLHTHAEQSWLFEGPCLAYNEEGVLIAKIHYSKGELEGESIYYHPNGKIWKISAYKKNKLNGSVKVLLENGLVLQTTEYKDGEKEGISIRYWDASHIAYQELYKSNLLLDGHYYDDSGKLICSIQNGKGVRALFGKAGVNELQEYQNGIQDGCVKVYDDSQHLTAIYSIKNGEKEGEEITYFPNSNQPKLLLTWHEGILQGPIKTWYENGQCESQKEMSGNQKNGFLTAWYRNGALMLIEEYECSKLIKGEYYRSGEKVPISQIERGKGIATLFNQDGNFSRKVFYQDGRPIE